MCPVQNGTLHRFDAEKCHTEFGVAQKTKKRHRSPMPCDSACKFSLHARYCTNGAINHLGDEVFVTVPASKRYKVLFWTKHKYKCA